MKILSYLFVFCKNFWISKLRKWKDFKLLEEFNELFDEEDIEMLFVEYEKIFELEKYFW